MGEMWMSGNSGNPMFDSRAFWSASNLFRDEAGHLPLEGLRSLAEEVLHRLVQTRSAYPVVHVGPSPAEIGHLCDALLSDDDFAARDLILAAHARGVPVETLYLGYLAGAVDCLGESWLLDRRVNTSSMIVAAGRVYGVMRGLRQLFGDEGPMCPDSYRAVFCSTPGEVHTMGVTMAADILRRHGWQVDLRAGYAHDALIDELRKMRVPIIGISTASADLIPSLARLIVALRVTNPTAHILLGGSLNRLYPDLARMVDADSMAEDLPQAEELMMAAVPGEGMANHP